MKKRTITYHGEFVLILDLSSFTNFIRRMWYILGFCMLRRSNHKILSSLVCSLFISWNWVVNILPFPTFIDSFKIFSFKIPQIFEKNTLLVKGVHFQTIKTNECPQQLRFVIRKMKKQEYLLLILVMYCQFIFSCLWCYFKPLTPFIEELIDLLLDDFSPFQVILASFLNFQ